MIKMYFIKVASVNQQLHSVDKRGSGKEESPPKLDFHGFCKWSFKV